MVRNCNLYHFEEVFDISGAVEVLKKLYIQDPMTSLFRLTKTIPRMNDLPIKKENGLRHLVSLFSSEFENSFAYPYEPNLVSNTPEGLNFSTRLIAFAQNISRLINSPLGAIKLTISVFDSSPGWNEYTSGGESFIDGKRVPLL